MDRWSQGRFDWMEAERAGKTPGQSLRNWWERVRGDRDRSRGEHPAGIVAANLAVHFYNLEDDLDRVAGD